MRRTFRKYTDANDIPVIRMSPKTNSEDVLPEKGPALCVNWDSRFPKEFFDDTRARFFHVIRDPRDVLISGHRYHLRPKHSHENWLHRPNPEFGGLSYHQKLVEQPNRVSQMIFEMDGKHARTLQDMLSWPYGHQHVVDLRYEDLIEDQDCTRFRAAISSMGVDGFDIDGLVKSYWNNSLFGGFSDRSNRTNNVKSHVLNGATQQWRSRLPREVAEIYVQKFGDALIRLGYATDHKWVNECLPDTKISN